MYKTNINTQHLIKNFESGEINNFQEDNEQPKKEQATSIPGLTKKLVSEYEVKKKSVVIENSTRPCVKGKLNILIVFAHWERDSFNGALLKTAVKALEEEGHEVVVSDLYLLGFNALPSKADVLDGLRYPAGFSYLTETSLAYERGSLAKDITAEQKKLSKADLVIFQFPINWASVPAILKGYFDRVLTYKFSYEFGVWFNHGKFKGKRAILSLTTGSGETAYSPIGYMGDIDIILWPIQNNVLRFCGWDVLKPNICFSPARCSDEQRKIMLNNWNVRVRQLVKEQPMEFFSIECFDPITGQLTEEGISQMKSSSGKSILVPIGQHGAGALHLQKM